MKKDNRISVLLIIIVTLVFCVGCGAPTFREEVWNQGKDKGWTDKQCQAARAYAHTYLLKEAQAKQGESQDDPLADTDIKTVLPVREVNYSMLSIDNLVKKLDGWLEDFDVLLGYSWPEEVKYVDFFGLRETLTHDEKVMKAVRARVKAAQLDLVFKLFLGQIPMETAVTDEYFGRYDIRRIFGPKNPIEAFKFNLDQIDEARNQGMLKLIESGGVRLDCPYDHKSLDPNNPDDNQAFIWKSCKFELDMSCFKILSDGEKPDNNRGNYIEVFRTTGSKRESYPCLKVFMINSGSVFVIDTKKEGEAGFGLPDYVLRSDNIYGVRELIADPNLARWLSGEKNEKERTPPKEVKVDAEISKTETAIDVWETSKNPKGFVVPFRYTNALLSNYNIRVEMHTEPFIADGAMSGNCIRYLKKEWTAGNRYTPSLGSVVEYYKPKAPYDTMKFLEVKVLASRDTRVLSLAKDDGSTELISILPKQYKYIEKKPIAIAYTSGDKRYIIKREASSDVYNKRKELSKNEVEATGFYEDDYGISDFNY